MMRAWADVWAVRWSESSRAFAQRTFVKTECAAVASRTGFDPNGAAGLGIICQRWRSVRRGGRLREKRITDGGRAYSLRGTRLRWWSLSGAGGRP